MDKKLVEGLASGQRPSQNARRDDCMLGYAEKLTRSPEDMTVQDIDQLRDHGFSDTAIVEINLVSAYMNFVNRIALGLGVDLEPSKEVFLR